MLIPGYRLSVTIYRSNSTFVCRGIRNADEKQVILKVLNSDYPTEDELNRFRLEYALISNLQLDGVIETLDFVEFGNTAALVFNDIGGDTLAHQIANKSNAMGVGAFLEFAISFTQILDQVHRKSIIHKDINPTNIIWNTRTNEINLIDFGISTELSRETPAILNPEMLEGTLAYMSPEQTGRMNRKMDYRTDLYSLGCVFYHMLTGVLPFSSKDPMELVHSHIARIPRSPHDIAQHVYPALSAIIMKLLAKTAEERYQTCSGLLSDLIQCRKSLSTQGTITPFELGRGDYSDQFQIPQKLYGRSTETSSLMKAFERIAEGGLELFLVAGYSGVGKSSLVQELYKPIVGKNGYFISGKFDQYQNDTPYHSIIQAFQKLVLQLLTESEARVQAWKKALFKSLGDEARVIVEVIPELELIMGHQPEVLKLSGGEAAKRFSRVFKQFLGVFCTRQNPLVLFLDDLQWADPASLQLIQTIVCQQGGQYLLILGAYRDNEVTAAHPLMLILDEIEAKKQPDTRITILDLQPLQLADTQLLICETLHADEKRGGPLAELIQLKTGGNPYFSTQLLTSLYEKKYIDFFHESGQWGWKLDRIQSVAITDNVADLLVEKISSLPAKTQELLLIASCLGNQFDLSTLSVISQMPPAKVANTVWSAVQEELITPLHQGYRFFQSSQSGEIADPEQVRFRFSHDRVQEAAYSKLSDDQRAELHLLAGRLLLKNREDDDDIFEIVTHLNYSIDHITDQQERDELAQLNLIAGKKAKSSTAYTAALGYFIRGLELLTEDGWQRHHELMFRLSRERIECEFLCGHLEKARELFRQTVKQTTDRQEQGSLYELMIRICHINYDYALGISLGREALKLFDIEIPEDPGEYEKATVTVLDIISSNAGDEESIMALVDGHAMADKDAITCCGIIHELWVCLFMSGHEQVLLPALILIRLSIDHGQSSVTAVGHIFYALILSMQQDYDKAYAFGKLAMELKDKYLNPLLAPKVHNTFCNFVNHYKNHVRTNIEIYEQSFRYCQQSGEIWWGAWAATFIRTARLIKGDSLDLVLRECKKYRDYIHEAEFEPLIEVQDCQLAKLTNLMDLTGTRTSLDCESYNEEMNVARMESMPFGLGLFWHNVFKSFVLLLYGEKKLALEASMIAEENKAYIPGLMMYPDHFFYQTLIITANWPALTEPERTNYFTNIHENIEQMKLWQSHCPENYRHRYLLMCAENARIAGNDLETMTLFEQAIEEAGKNGFLHHEALANELAGKYYLANRRSRAARGYLIEARYLYSRWGAKRKVRYFDQDYPEISLLSPVKGESQTIATTGKSQILDLHSIMKASQTISGEIIFEKLLTNLMTILMENGGAQKGYLLLEENGEMNIRAEAVIDQREVVTLRTVPVKALQPDELLPISVLNYVARSHKSIVLNDAADAVAFMGDPYITAKQPKSILCTPLINQGKLDGLLYLENNLTPGAFTPDRLEALTLLSVQAAISIVNASLYTTMERKVQERTAELVQANIALQAEVTERKRVELALIDANRELHHQVSLDGLTQIANRRYLDDYLKAEWQRMRREQSPISLIICDIDHFKYFNDAYGHQIGDDCLKKITKAMTLAVKRPADLVARFGGEEFVLVLPNSDLTGAVHVARAIQHNVKALHIPHSRSPVSNVVTLSMGIASKIPQSSDSIEDFIYQADQLLYDAKKKGRNTFEPQG